MNYIGDWLILAQSHQLAVRHRDVVLAPGSTTSHCPAVAGQNMVPRYNIPSQLASSGAPRQEGTSVTSRGLDISPPTRALETVGLASEGAQLIDSGTSTGFAVGN